MKLASALERSLVSDILATDVIVRVRSHHRWIDQLQIDPIVAVCSPDNLEILRNRHLARKGNVVPALR